MQIYGKEFSDVFRDIPWPYKIVVVLGSAYLVFIVLHLSYLAVHTVKPKMDKSPLAIMKELNESTLDPSLASDPVSKNVYMVYSSIEGAGSITQGGISTALAFSPTPCKGWQNMGMVFETRNEELYAPNGQDILTRGIWRYETPSLVYDPKDIGKEWKVFAYKYFWSGDVSLAKQYGVIVTKYSNNPASNKWSEEEWLFGAAPDHPPAPYQQMTGVLLSQLSPALAGYAYYSRPSVVIAGDHMLMTLSAFKDATSPESVVLLGSSDHGKTWRYMGMPLQKSDAAKTGAYTRLGGATLLSEKGKIYLAAVFGDAKTAGTGTDIMRFSDLTNGVVIRDKDGKPQPLKHVPLTGLAPAPAGGGFGGYSDGCEQGMYTSEATATGFQIFKSYRTLAAAQ